MLKFSAFNNIRSITLKFVALLAPAVTLTTIIFCAFYAILNYQHENTELAKKLDLIVKTNVGAIAEPLWSIDSESVKKSVRTIVIHPEIICALVTDTHWAEPIMWPEGCNNEVDKNSSVSSQLISRDQFVGNLHLFYTRAPIHEKLLRDVMVNALLFVFLLLVSAIIAYLALRLIIKTPLDHLLRSIRSADEGITPPVTGWKAKDEMGVVVEAYNQMIDQAERYTSELVIAREEAEKAGLSKTRFLASMSHELRTPLNAVIGITEMMRDMAVKKEENIEPYERVTRAGRHLLGLIDNILDFSKIDADRVELHIEETATQPFIYDIHNTSTELVRRNNNEFNLECGILPPTIRIDILRLTQILINLIGNACKFTKDGTVTLQIEPMDNPAPNSETSTESDKCFISFRVIDTGIGMSREQIDQLFVDFSQFDTAVTRKYGGTGLGLAISQRLCQMMDSKIRVSSELGKGSVFSFTLAV